MTTFLTGWGRTAPTPATLARPRSVEHLSELVAAAAGGRGVVARGLGRSYGDAAQNAGGLVLDCTGLDTWTQDEASGLVTASGGVSLHDLMTALVPRGWFVPVSPGTRHVTVGGAIAADVHGKNHHRDSSFGAHVRSLTLVTADGTVRTLHPGDPLFRATVGGMGLTGVIAEATFACVPVETALMRVDVQRTADLDETLATMEATDDRYRYTVAWIDLLAQGSRMGRSVLTRGDHLPRDDGKESPAFAPGASLRAPAWVPGGLLNRVSVRAFNEVWYRKAPRRKTIVQGIAPFFHPLDFVEGWNRVYGPRGFVQYQFVVPFGAEDTLRDIVGSLSAHGTVSFLTVLKRFGPGSGGLLSFPMPGWTLALDIPVGQRGLDGLLRGFDRRVADVGGRVYLAKDSRLRADMMAAMYPELERWRRIKDEADPAGLFRSDLARRLRL
ncbi:decaprenylphospho-beta-D-ribofuranose 2-oxidase [Nonomuraea polychroma]|uniref:Decaprenylphospho-beta-D-ribofuranose 2-oxidase n=1 Tax=Nonomuraea polychroma TaxID=46176 RepID=A0A438MNW9_9ACTN|nr:FAD-binding oxidoreductase [Nonomuraea polychroma]RVX47574.1 decaprenylphospho-beta-D-ribofuranose 2-oxidase [Nonomuraea polychroma]